MSDELSYCPISDTTRGDVHLNEAESYGKPLPGDHAEDCNYRKSWTGLDRALRSCTCEHRVVARMRERIKPTVGKMFRHNVRSNEAQLNAALIYGNSSLAEAILASTETPVPASDITISWTPLDP